MPSSAHAPARGVSVQVEEPLHARSMHSVEAQVMERFTATGLTDHLAPAELKRRAQEAASVMVRLLAESRLLVAHGDLTSPEAFSLPDGVLRRILAQAK
jgi:hypothetical protein